MCDKTMCGIVIDRDKVLRLIRSLDANKAHGWNEISAHMVKIYDSSLLNHCVTFERCLATGIYPSTRKKANIVSIDKKESRQNKENYFPISLLPIFGNIFEKLNYDAMYKHLCDNNILTPNQSGFRAVDSPVNQLLAITQEI